METGRLYLVPNLLGGGAPADVLPPRTIETVRTLRRFVAENACHQLQNGPVVVNDENAHSRRSVISE